MTKLTEFKPDPNNANKGTQRGLKALDQSLRQVGAGRSLVSDRNGTILVGNKTQERAIDIGLDEAIVVETDGTKVVVVKRTDLDLANDEDGRARALATYDNRVGELDLSWDVDALRQVNGEILKDLFTFAELENMGFTTRPIQDAAPKSDKAEALAKKWGTGPGQVWTIDTHRLLCGDATKKTDFDKLTQGARANLVFTDPPYGVSYIGVKTSTQEPRWEMLENDELRGEELYRFLKESFQNLFDATEDETAAYVFHASSTQMEFERALNDAGYQVKQQLVWNKGMVLGRSDYQWAHELIFYARKANQKTPWYGDRTAKTVLRQKRTDIADLTKDQMARILQALVDQSTVWEIDRDEVNTYQHSTQKPTDLAIRAIENSSQPGETVIDCFLGSGTTMIAAENLGRRCLGMELDPKWLAVALERMSTAFPRAQITREE